MVGKIGLKFAKLTVVSLAENRVLNNRKIVKQFNCICDCGSSLVIESSKLTHHFISSNRNKGCGSCFRKGLSDRFSKHKKSRTSEYRSWSSMKARCYNKNNDFYHNYGGRGITVCGRWIDSFENFISDMGFKPSKSHTIDRIDNDMGYSKDNCRWATKKEQAINRKSARNVTINGKTDSLLGWYNTIKPNISYSVFVKKINTNQATVSDFMTSGCLKK